ncbi:VanW family protein [Candidatus Woesebacteria bacterium]|nr:VanW family protein [Candidatus Woesebacteria bacterium]
MKKIKKYFKSPSVMVFLILLVETIFAIYNLFYWNKVYPGIYIAGLSVGGKTLSSTEEFLKTQITQPENIELTSDIQNFELGLKDINFSYNYALSAEKAYSTDRTGNFLYDIKSRLLSPFRKTNLNLAFNLDNEKLQKNLSIIAGIVTQDPISPSIKLENSKIRVDKGKPGTELDTDQLTASIYNTLSSRNELKIKLPVHAVNKVLTENEAEVVKSRAEKIINKTLSAKFEFQTYKYKGADLLNLIDPIGGYNDQEIQKIVNKIETNINRKPQNPTFVFENNKVKEFAPAVDGIKTKTQELGFLINQNLKTLEETETKEASIDIPTEKTPPEIKTGDINNLGINELIGRGTSRFKGSIPSRVHNVVLAASKLNGILVNPGDTFSFNDALGDISEFTGYQQAYVIKDGKTVLGDGGGVCQVSTTLFRAILNAGLPITERAAHAYRVGYYEQDGGPGFDATVYSPSPDLKFKNDTPGHILIQAKADPKNLTLVFELYGTKDGRTATVTKPVISNVTPPPDDLYQDDPTLPAGTIKQVEHKAWGAKVIFNYTVTKDGQITYKKTFISNYRPWQAVYLRGTGPAI